MRLSIAARFNLVFVSLFAVGFVAAGFVADSLLRHSARQETLQNARLLQIRDPSCLACHTSMGNFDADDVDARGSDELGALGRSFNRMRTSLASAMRMLDE